MKAEMRVTLRAGERIFINGAVLRVKDKVTLSLLNDARFLLESHVLQLSQATTPMRQLYFVVQALLMNPKEADQTMVAFHNLHEALILMYPDPRTRDTLRSTRELVENDKAFEALKLIRGLFEVDDARTSQSAKCAAENAA